MATPKQIMEETLKAEAEAAEKLESAVNDSSPDIEPDKLIDEPLHIKVNKLIKKQAVLFHDSEDTGYATYPRGSHIETHPLDSMAFKKYASYLAFSRFEQALARESMSSLIGLLNANAAFDGEHRKVERRIAHRDGTYYIDICDKDWRVIEIVPGSHWRVIDSHKNPVKFIRSRTAQALPIPEPGGDISTLWKYINIVKADRIRVLTLILDTFRPQTQYPILSIKAQAGCGKTEAVNTIRLLTDPNKALTTRAPNSTRDVLSNAQNNHVLAFDNLSSITDELSDLFCCMATGAGHRERRLYTNTEEAVVELKRQVIFDGIEFLPRRDDLVDRIIHIELPQLKNNVRISERQLSQEREINLPLILGALLDLFVAATDLIDKLPSATGVRMLDYADLGQAVCQVLGEEQDFARELEKHQSSLKARVMGSSPFLMQFLEILGDMAQDKITRLLCTSWLGVKPMHRADGAYVFSQYPGKLLTAMRFQAKEMGLCANDWPRANTGVMGVFDRNKTALQNLGLEYTKLGHDERGSLYQFVYKRADGGKK